MLKRVKNVQVYIKVIL